MPRDLNDRINDWQSDSASQAHGSGLDRDDLGSQRGGGGGSVRSAAHSSRSYADPDMALVRRDDSGRSTSSRSVRDDRDAYMQGHRGSGAPSVSSRSAYGQHSEINRSSGSRSGRDHQDDSASRSGRDRYDDSGRSSFSRSGRDRHDDPNRSSFSRSGRDHHDDSGRSSFSRSERDYDDVSGRSSASRSGRDHEDDSGRSSVSRSRRDDHHYSRSSSGPDRYDDSGRSSFSRSSRNHHDDSGRSTASRSGRDLQDLSLVPFRGSAPSVSSRHSDAPRSSISVDHHGSQRSSSSRSPPNPDLHDSSSASRHGSEFSSSSSRTVKPSPGRFKAIQEGSTTTGLEGNLRQLTLRNLGKLPGDSRPDAEGSVARSKANSRGHSIAGSTKTASHTGSLRPDDTLSSAGSHRSRASGTHSQADRHSSSASATGSASRQGHQHDMLHHSAEFIENRGAYEVESVGGSRSIFGGNSHLDNQQLVRAGGARSTASSARSRTSHGGGRDNQIAIRGQDARSIASGSTIGRYNHHNNENLAIRGFTLLRRGDSNQVSRFGSHQMFQQYMRSCVHTSSCACGAYSFTSASSFTTGSMMGGSALARSMAGSRFHQDLIVENDLDLTDVHIVPHCAEDGDEPSTPYQIIGTYVAVAPNGRLATMRDLETDSAYYITQWRDAVARAEDRLEYGVIRTNHVAFVLEGLREVMPALTATAMREFGNIANARIAQRQFPR